MNDHFSFMQMAILEAKKASALDEVPIGALVVSEKGEVLSLAGNTKETERNPLGHAELNALLLASKKLSNWRLENCTLYVSLEPCPMCLGAMVHARIKRLVFGAYDTKGGALSLGHRLHQDPRLNHRFEVIGGILQKEAGELLSDFFKKKRQR